MERIQRAKNKYLFFKVNQFIRVLSTFKRDEVYSSGSLISFQILLNSFVREISKKNIQEGPIEEVD